VLRHIVELPSVQGKRRPFGGELVAVAAEKKRSNIAVVNDYLFLLALKIVGKYKR
jgi:hypothetical protein